MTRTDGLESSGREHGHGLRTDAQQPSLSHAVPSHRSDNVRALARKRDAVPKAKRFGKSHPGGNMTADENDLTSVPRVLWR